MHQRKFFFYLPPPFFNLDPEESGTEIGQCMVTKLLHNATLAFCRRSVKIEMAANAGISPKISGPADSKPLDAWDDKAQLKPNIVYFLWDKFGVNWGLLKPKINPVFGLNWGLCWENY